MKPPVQKVYFHIHQYCQICVQDLQNFPQFITRKFAITEYFGKQSDADCFIAVYGYDSGESIGMAKKMVATFGTLYLEADAREHGDELLPVSAGRVVMRRWLRVECR